MKEITINWHIIQRCNFTCDYCFAKYDKEDKKELHYSKQDIDIVLNKLYLYFSNRYKDYSLRLNIAGGEPTLSKNLEYIIEMAYKLNFSVSLITNASKLTGKFIEKNSRLLSMLAISIDSSNVHTNKKIGRSSTKNELMNSSILKYVELFRLYNPNINIKINTVVNSNNHHEYMGSLIELIQPEKWKILQALSFSKTVYCTDNEFNIFLNKHKNVQSSIYKESNEDMVDSYIMIDPYGRFYQNTKGSYIYSQTILTTSVAEAFNEIEFDLEKFMSRYDKV